MLGAIIGAGISVAASAIGAAIGNARKRKAEEAYRDSIDREIEEIDNEINANYLDRADAQNAIRKATDANEEALRQLNTDAIRGGATEEAKVAMASKLNKGTASLVGDLAAIGEQRKDALRQQKRSLRLGQAQYNYAIGSDTTGLDTIVQSISGAANSLGTAWDSRTPEAMTLGSNPMDTTKKIEGQAMEALKDKMPIEVDPDVSNVEKHKVKQYGSR